jgi:hypothetical protein
MGWRDAARAGTFEAWRDDRRFVAAARLVRDLTPPNSAVLAMIHSGSLRYYGGRLTIRYDVLDHDWLDQGVAWLNARGVRVYALLEEWEMAPFAARFAGERLARRLDETPLAVAADGAFRLYDLSESPAHGVAAASAVAVDDMPGRLRSQSPAPTPALVFAP